MLAGVVGGGVVESTGVGEGVAGDAAEGGCGAAEGGRA